MPEIGVEILAEDRTGRGIKSAEKGVGRLRGAIRGVTSAAKFAALGLGGIAVAGVGLGTALASQFVATGKELSRFANRTGHTVEQLSAMGFAAERVGLDLEDMIDVTEEMRIKANDVASGIETYATFFEELGINAKEYLALSPDEQFNLTAESLKNVEDATRRTIIADELLSDTGKRLLQVTQSNADGFAGLAAEAEEAGRIMRTETVNDVTRMNTAFNTLKDKGLGLATKAFEGLAPVLADAAEDVIGFVDDTLPDMIAWGEDVVDGLIDAKDTVVEWGTAAVQWFGAAKDAVQPVIDVLVDAGTAVGNFAGDSVTKITEWHTNVSDKFNSAKERVTGFFDALFDREPPDISVEAEVKMPTGAYDGHPILDGISNDLVKIERTLVPGADEAINGMVGSQAVVVYHGHPVLVSIDSTLAGISEKATNVDTQLNGMSSPAALGDIRGDLDGIAGGIPEISAAFVTETDPVAAAIAGFAEPFGNLDAIGESTEKVGLTTAEVRDKVDFNVRAMIARLGPLGFPIGLLWLGISKEFEKGGDDTVAEVVAMNAGLEVETATTLRGMDLFIPLLKMSWGVVSGVFGSGRTDTVAEVAGMNTDLSTEATAIDTEMGMWETIFAPHWAVIKAVFAVGRSDTVAEMVGMNVDLGVEALSTVNGLQLLSGLITGNLDLVVEAFSGGRTDSVAEMAGLNTDLETETSKTTGDLKTWASDNLGPGWQLVIDAFNLGRTDSMAEVVAMNAEMDIETTTTSNGLTLWGALLHLGWKTVSGEFGKGHTDIISEMKGMNLDLETETTTTSNGLTLWVEQNLGPGWELIVGAFNLGRTNVDSEMKGLNAALETETTTTTTGLSLWDSILGISWGIIRDTFGVGRSDVQTEMQGLNADLDTETTTTTTGFSLWDEILGGWWTTIQSTFNVGRTDVDTEMKALNADLEVETTTTNNGLDFWQTILNSKWLNLAGEFRLGKDKSIAEAKKISSYLDEENRGGTGSAAQGIDFWALLIYGRFDDLKNTISGPINAVVGVINSIRDAVNGAISALGRLRQAKVDIPNLGPPPAVSSGAPLHGGIGGGSRGGGSRHPNEPGFRAFATGGIVTQPTFALIGEAGPEAVIPLSGGGGAGLRPIINVYVNVAGSLVREHELDTHIHRTVNRAIQTGTIPV